MSSGFIQLNATEWNSAKQIPWSPNPPFVAKEIPLYPTLPSAAQTLEEEVLVLTKEWYAARGKKIPKAEEAACLEMIEKEAKEKLKPIEQTAAVSSKADYGTKQYWAEYWAKKKAEGYVSKADQKKKDAEAKAAAKAEAAAAKEKAKADAAAAKAAAKEAAKGAKLPAAKSKTSAKTSSLSQSIAELTQSIAALSVN